MSKPRLILKEAAVKQFSEVLQKQPKAVKGIRALVDGANATEFLVKLGFEQNQKEDDIVIDCGPFKVFVDPQSMKNLEGTSIDFVDGPKGKGFKIDNPNKPSFGPKTREGLLDDPQAKAIHDFINENINPAVAQHGGVISLLDVKNDTIYIHMGGGCQGCSQSTATLKQGVEKSIQERFPQIKKIIDTTDHASGTNPYYKS